jgi:hypothetical protein
MAMVNSSSPIRVFTKDTGRRTKSMVRVNLTGLMDVIIKVNGLAQSFMARVFTLGLMDVSMMVSTSTIKKAGKELIRGLMAKDTRELG